MLLGKMKIPHAQKRETGTFATHSGKCLPTHQKLVCKEMKMSVHIGCKYYFAFLDKKWIKGNNTSVCTRAERQRLPRWEEAKPGTSPKTSQAEDGAQSKLETHRDPGRKDSETHGNRVQSFEG